MCPKSILVIQPTFCLEASSYALSPFKHLPALRKHSPRRAQSRTISLHKRCSAHIQARHTTHSIRITRESRQVITKKTRKFRGSVCESILQHMYFCYHQVTEGLLWKEIQISDDGRRESNGITTHQARPYWRHNEGLALATTQRRRVHLLST